MSFDYYEIIEAFKQIKQERVATKQNERAKSNVDLNVCTIKSLVNKETNKSRMHSQNNPTGMVKNCAAIEVGSQSSAEMKDKGLIDASKSMNPHALKALRACDRVGQRLKNSAALKASRACDRGDESVPIAGTEKPDESVNNENPEIKKVNQGNCNRLSGGDDASKVVNNDNERRRKGRPEKQKKGRPPNNSGQENKLPEEGEHLEGQVQYIPDDQAAAPAKEKPIKLSELINTNKVTPETLSKCYKERFR